MSDFSYREILPFQFADFFQDFYLDPSIFPQNADDVEDLWIADYFDASSSQKEGTDFPRDTRKTRKRKVEEDSSSITSNTTSSETTDVLAPEPKEPPNSHFVRAKSGKRLKGRKLNPKLLEFIPKSKQLLMEGNIEELTDLVKSTFRPDHKFINRTAGHYFEGIGCRAMINFYSSIATIFPDFVSNEGNLRLAEDKGGTYVATNFHFTGTRSIATPYDHMFFGESGFLGQMDPSELDEEMRVQLKGIEEAQRENKKMKITAVGLRKYYIDFDSNLYRESVFEWKIAAMQIGDDGEKLVLLPFSIPASAV